MDTSTNVTHIAIRIDIQNSDQIKLFKDYLLQNNYTNILIGPVEYKSNKQPHFHAVFDIPIQDVSERWLNTKLRNPLKDLGIIYPRQFSVKVVEITERYPTLEQAYLYYISYCRKGLPHYYTTMSTELLNKIPEWIPIKDLKTKKQLTIKEQIKQGYVPITSKKSYEQRIHIIEYLLNYYKQNDKPFTSSSLRMYGNYLLSQFYELHPQVIYAEFFRNGDGLF